MQQASSSSVTYRHARGTDTCQKVMTRLDDGSINISRKCASGSEGHTRLQATEPGTYRFNRKQTYRTNMTGDGTIGNTQFATGHCSVVAPASAKEACLSLGLEQCDAFDQKGALNLKCDVTTSLDHQNKRGGSEATVYYAVAPKTGGETMNFAVHQGMDRPSLVTRTTYGQAKPATLAAMKVPSVGSGGGGAAAQEEGCKQQ